MATMEDTRASAYPPGRHPDLPPPRGSTGVLGWLRANLFSSVFSTFLTVLALWLTYELVAAVIDWFLLDAVLEADSRDDCRARGGGACWAVVATRVDQFVFGFYPHGERWRPVLTAVLLVPALAPVLFDRTPYRGRMLRFSLAYPFLGAWLIHGDGWVLPVAHTDSYGGFLLTMILGVTGIVASLPLGIALALGRQSSLLAVRLVCVAFIEVLRGVPLITLLFIASTMLNYFLPPGTNFNLLIRVLIMVTLFAAAYLAEAVRGGLQAIPRGQYEAADALGLSYWKATWLITLPQALKISIPGIVNVFIGLYKDSTLVVIIGLLDPLGVARAILADHKWNGLSNETYIFVALFFFFSCFAMSRYSLWLEARLSVDKR